MYTDSLVVSPKFKTVKFQIERRGQFRERMFCYDESIVFGVARRLLQKGGGSGFHLIRHKFFVRFVMGQPKVLTEREQRYLLGMQNALEEAFPHLVDMDGSLA